MVKVRKKPAAEPDGKPGPWGARLFVLALGLAVAAALALAAAYAELGGSWPAFLAILGVAVAVEMAAVRLPTYGAVGLGFFAVFAAMARTPALYGPEWDSFKEVAIVSQALAIAFTALLLRTLFVTSDQPALHRACDLFIDLVRVYAVGLVYLFVAYRLPGKYDLFSPWAWVGLVAAAGAYWLVDQILSGTAVNLLADEPGRELWWQAHRRATVQAGSALVALGYLATLVAEAAAQIAELSAAPALLLGLGVAAVPALALRASLRAWVEEPAQQLKEVQADELRGALEAEKRKVEAMSLREEGLSKDLQKKGADLEMLYGMARDLGASTDLQESLDIVLRLIRRMQVPHQTCAVFLVNDDGRAYPAKSITPFREVLEMSSLLHLEEPAVNEVIKTRRPRISSEGLSSTDQRIFKDERSVLCVPMIVSKEVIGALYVGAKTEGVYDDDHLHALTMLAAHAAPSIKTAQLFEGKEEDLAAERKLRSSVEAKNRTISGLQRIGQQMGKELKLSNTFETVSSGIKEMIPDVQSVIFFLGKGEEDSNELAAEWTDSPYKEYVKTLPVRKDDGLLGEAIKQSRTFLVNDTSDNIIAYERSVIAAPLTSGSDEVLGCLYVGAASDNAFTEEHRSLIETVSYQAALAIKNALLYEQTQQQALTDGLTGLYSHRFFQVQLEEEIKWARRNNTKLCLVMVDTDHFKSYNDTLGHPAGDALLREIAALLRDSVRATDIVCRYGGDEFALLIKESAKEDCVKIAEKIRQAFEFRFGVHAVKVTASIGLACFPSDARDRKELAKVSDVALYKSKRGGRNRVSAAPTLEEAQGMPEEQIEPLPR